MSLLFNEYKKIYIFLLNHFLGRGSPSMENNGLPPHGGSGLKLVNLGDIWSEAAVSLLTEGVD